MPFEKDESGARVHVEGPELGNGITQWPEWICKGSCGLGPFPPDTPHKKCPGTKGRPCGCPLIRYKQYEVKQ